MAQETQYELVKATSKNVLYIGVLLLIIGMFLLFKTEKYSAIGGVIGFFGFITTIFWVANRKDQMCPTNDNSPCKPV